MQVVIPEHRVGHKLKVDITSMLRVPVGKSLIYQILHILAIRYVSHFLGDKFRIVIHLMDKVMYLVILVMHMRGRLE